MGHANPGELLRTAGPARQAAARLRAAFDEHGPAPCQTSPTPQAWDLDSTVVLSMRLAKTAVAACWTCPARVACLELATAGGERYGIWGGLTPGERDDPA